MPGRDNFQFAFLLRVLDLLVILFGTAMYTHLPRVNQIILLTVQMGYLPEFAYRIRIPLHFDPLRKPDKDLCNLPGTGSGME